MPENTDPGPRTPNPASFNETAEPDVYWAVTTIPGFSVESTFDPSAVTPADDVDSQLARTLRGVSQDGLLLEFAPMSLRGDPRVVGG